MTQEEKAKAYDEALERARQCLKDGTITNVAIGYIEDIFPELAESEDERIRKALIIFFNRFPYDSIESAGTNAKEAIAWLEKQGEQKPADKVEPKFKVGDWIIIDENHNGVYQVERMDNYRYYLRHYLGGVLCTLSVHFDNEIIRLWTIQDAKKGDVLARNIDILSICIFSRFDGINNKYSTFLCRCGLEGEGLGQNLSINGYYDDSKDYVPATKEQRDTLFAKMKEAGYEWDAENKEPKKIEQIPYGQGEEIRGKEEKISPKLAQETVIDKLDEIIGKLGDLYEVLSKPSIYPYEPIITTRPYYTPPSSVPGMDMWYKTHGVEKVTPVTSETLSTMYNLPHVSGTKGKKSPFNSEEEDNEE